MIIYPTIIIVFLAFAINAIVGFGGGLLAVPFLALFYPLIIVSPFMNLLGLFSNVILIKAFYKNIQYRLLVPLVIGNLIGASLGSGFLILASNTLLVKLLGITILMSSIFIFTFNGKIQIKANVFLGIIAGLISGFLSAVFAVGAAPIVLYLSAVIKEKSVFRSVSLAFFLINGMMQISLFTLHGLITKQILLLFALSFPIIILASWLGNKLHMKVEEKLFKRIIFATLVFSSALLILK